MIAEALLALALSAPAPADTLTVNQAVESVRSRGSAYTLRSVCPGVGSFDHEVWSRMLELSVEEDRPWDATHRPVLEPYLVGALLRQRCDTLPFTSWFLNWFGAWLRQDMSGSPGGNWLVVDSFLEHVPDGPQLYELLVLREARTGDDLTLAVIPLIRTALTGGGGDLDLLDLLQRLVEVDAPTSRAIGRLAGILSRQDRATEVLIILERVRPARPAELLPVLGDLRSSFPEEERVRLDALRVRLGGGGGV